MQRAKKIFLYAEDDWALGRIAERDLARDWSVAVCATGAEALQLIEKKGEEIGAALLDVELPGGDSGRYISVPELAQGLRRRGVTLIGVITAGSGSEYDSLARVARLPLFSKDNIDYRRILGELEAWHSGSNREKR